jgi:hypothetical protein
MAGIRNDFTKLKDELESITYDITVDENQKINNIRREKNRNKTKIVKESDAQTNINDEY